MCEIRDMGIKWPQWHTWIFEGQGRVHMRVVCPQDVKKMLLRQAIMVHWRKWAAKHECEELKGVWLDPIQAMLRGRINEEWTDKHRNVMRKLVSGGGWVQKRFYDIGWSDDKTCQGCNKEGTEKHRLYHCPCWKEIRSKIPEKVRKWEQRARKEESRRVRKAEKMDIPS